MVGGRLAVVIRVGHDLTGALKRLAPSVRYIRVATKAYREAAGD
jgi:hypothetical protein